MRAVVMTTDKLTGNGFVLASMPSDFDAVKNFGGLVYTTVKSMVADKADDVRSSLLILQLDDSPFEELQRLVNEDPEGLIEFNREQAEANPFYVMSTVHSPIDYKSLFKVVQQVLTLTRTPFDLMEAAPE